MIGRVRLVPLMIGLTLMTACAAKPGLGTTATEWKQKDFRWTYKNNVESGHSSGPVAVYGPPETLASLSFVCEHQEQALHFLEIEGDAFAGERPITIAAGGESWSGFQVTEPPDGVVIVRTIIPLGHPVVDAIEQGNTSILVTGEAGASPILNDPAIARVIRECRVTRSPD